MKFKKELKKSSYEMTESVKFRLSYEYFRWDSRPVMSSENRGRLTKYFFSHATRLEVDIVSIEMLPQAPSRSYQLVTTEPRFMLVWIKLYKYFLS